MHRTELILKRKCTVVSLILQILLLFSFCFVGASQVEADLGTEQQQVKQVVFLNQEDPSQRLLSLK